MPVDNATRVPDETKRNSALPYGDRIRSRGYWANK